MFQSANVVYLWGQQKPEGSFPTREEIRHQVRLRQSAMMQEAILAQQWAVSHRDVHIGASVLACKPGRTEEERFGTELGWNSTIKRRRREDNHSKPCAERHGIVCSLVAGYWEAVHVVLYTPHNQHDDISGLLLPSMPPCNACANYMAHVMRPHSTVTTFRDRMSCDFYGNGATHWREEIRPGVILRLDEQYLSIEMNIATLARLQGVELGRDF